VVPPPVPIPIGKTPAVKKTVIPKTPGRNKKEDSLKEPAAEEKEAVDGNTPESVEQQPERSLKTLKRKKPQAKTVKKVKGNSNTENVPEEPVAAVAEEPEPEPPVLVRMDTVEVRRRPPPRKRLQKKVVQAILQNSKKSGFCINIFSWQMHFCLNVNCESKVAKF
jgi:hypothetical protein